jgi:hypothetical protein
VLRTRVPAAVACALALAACGARGGHFATLDYEFDHPPEWTALERVELPNAGDAKADTVGLDRGDWVAVIHDRLAQPLTAGELAGAPRRLRATYGAAMERAGVRLLGEATVTRLRGYDALEYAVAFAADDGTPLRTRVVALFRGVESFTVGCQSSPAHADEIGAGCDQVLDTLEPAP